MSHYTTNIQMKEMKETFSNEGNAFSILDHTKYLVSLGWFFINLSIRLELSHYFDLPNDGNHHWFGTKTRLATLNPGVHAYINPRWKTLVAWSAWRLSVKLVKYTNSPGRKRVKYSLKAESVYLPTYIGPIKLTVQPPTTGYRGWHLPLTTVNWEHQIGSWDRNAEDQV